jgi:hypothetical protein
MGVSKSFMIFGFGCKVINTHLIPCNKALPKMLSFIAISKILESCFVTVCEVLWHPVCAYHSVIQMVKDYTVHIIK